MFVEIIINRRDADLTVTQFDTICAAVQGLVKTSEALINRGSAHTRDTLHVQLVETGDGYLALANLAEQLRECLPILIELTHVWSFCTAEDSANGTAFVCLELDD
jgi:hypothetical protein